MVSYAIHYEYKLPHIFYRNEESGHYTHIDTGKFIYLPNLRTGKLLNM